MGRTNPSAANNTAAFSQLQAENDALKKENRDLRQKLARKILLIIGICRFVINFRIPINKYDVVIRTVADQEGNIVRFYVFKFL